MNLMGDIRKNIKEQTFSTWSIDYLKRMNDHKGM
jgi:hypothetical protein